MAPPGEVSSRKVWFWFGGDRTGGRTEQSQSSGGVDPDLRSLTLTLVSSFQTLTLAFYLGGSARRRMVFSFPLPGTVLLFFVCTRSLFCLAFFRLGWVGLPIGTVGSRTHFFFEACMEDLVCGLLLGTWSLGIRCDGTLKSKKLVLLTLFCVQVAKERSLEVGYRNLRAAETMLYRR